MPDNYTASEENIRKRRCPICSEPIKIYNFYGAILPLEALANEAIDNFGKFTKNKIVTSISKLNLCPMFEIQLGSTCLQCGHVDYWLATTRDIEILCKDAMAYDGYYIQMTYERDELQKLIDMEKNERIKEYYRQIHKALEDARK